MPFQKCPYSCGHGLRIPYAAYFYHVINFSFYLSFTVHSVHFIERKAQGFMSVLSIRIFFDSIYQFNSYLEKFSIWVGFSPLALNMILSRLNFWNTSRPRLPSPGHRQCPPSLQWVDGRQILGAKPVIEHKKDKRHDMNKCWEKLTTINAWL